MNVQFPTNAHEAKFRHVLGRMSVAIVERDENRIVSSFRPTDLFAFEQKLHASGLKNCPVSNALVKYLAMNPSESLRIVVER